jgi:hypothetical protein
MFLTSLSLPAITIPCCNFVDPLYPQGLATFYGWEALVYSPLLILSLRNRFPAPLLAIVPCANLWLLTTPLFSFLPRRFARAGLLISAIALAGIGLPAAGSLYGSTPTETPALLQGFYLWAGSFAVSFAGFVLLSSSRQLPTRLAAQQLAAGDPATARSRD